MELNAMPHPGEHLFEVVHVFMEAFGITEDIIQIRHTALISQTPQCISEMLWVHSSIQMECVPIHRAPPGGTKSC